MRQHWLSLVAVVAGVALASAGCDRPASITSPGSTVTPRADVTAGAYTVDGYTLLTSSGSSSRTTTLVVNETGWRLNIGPNSLEIPAGAVSGPTLFVFTLQSSPYIAAKLSAYQVTADGKNKWIQGAPVTTFAKRLTLTLSYSQSATAIPDPLKLLVLWIENGTVLEQYKPDVDVQGKKLITTITHFSEYSPGLPPVGDSGLPTVPMYELP